MATELIELGKAKTISRSGIQRAASRSACESAGGFWRERGGRTWMKKAGECMTPPSWLVEHWRNKGIEVTVLDGMCDLGDADACAMTGVAASGLGYFVKPGEGCPPGYKKVRTRHPLWKKGDFYMCVRPEAIPGLRARGLLSGLDGFWPTGGSPQNILFGVLTGSFANTFVGTALPKFIPTIADYAPFVSYGVSALTAIAHVFMGSDFSFGLFLGTLGPSIEALGRQLAELISPTAKAPAAMPAPTTTTPTTSGMGQPAPSEIERLRKKLRISFKPVAGTSNMGGNGNANGMGAAKVERPLKVF
ncbi:MAG: hypothetical protein DRJ03_07355 [Chloroflexi bacterium]|nr:MAG: hypothetical protein DRJ03_07355 [Chloroflexota bacterium]